MSVTPLMRGRIPPSDANGWDVAVTVIGGALPSWTRPDPTPTEQPHFEIVIVDDADPQPNTLARLHEILPRIRLAVVSDHAASSVVPNCSLRVSAAPEHLSLVAEAFVRLSTGMLFVGVDMIELMMVSNAIRRAEAPDASGRRTLEKHVGYGRSIIIDKVAIDPLPQTIRDHDHRLRDAGYAGGAVILQLVGEPDSSSFTMFDLDRFFTVCREACSGRDLVMTAAPASSSATLMIGFA
ncbi:hypothetical protein JKG68_10805 [Microvirga aerilata]|uniref:Uncharacterized protein n=1 Tax=Microvirga aerilata TaxID=670292 RepID=A0A937CWY0_9HYPH|nr:hypothetical protein [Microvirga aerilata]MBL0404458.1 hypothetical protein [Microvirga aerilata]